MPSMVDIQDMRLIQDQGDLENVFKKPFWLYFQEIYSLNHDKSVCQLMLIVFFRTRSVHYFPRHNLSN